MKNRLRPQRTEVTLAEHHGSRLLQFGAFLPLAFFVISMVLEAKADDESACPNTRLSLVVSGRDPKHIESQLEKLEKLAKRGVSIGEVYISGYYPGRWLAGDSRGNRFPSNLSFAQQVGTAAVGPYFRHLEPLKLIHFQLEPNGQIFDRLAVTYSPTWIVRYCGEDYVYEGFSEPEDFFNMNGAFTGAN